MNKNEAPSETTKVKILMALVKLSHSKNDYDTRPKKTENIIALF